MSAICGHVNPKYDKIIYERQHVFPFYKKFECVYFIKSHNFVKIGSTTFLYQRLCSIKVDNVLPELIGLFIRPDCRGLEKKLHDRFVRYRVRGEWFYFNEDMVDFVDLHMNAYDREALPFYKKFVNDYEEFFNRRMGEILVDGSNAEEEWIR